MKRTIGMIDNWRGCWRTALVVASGIALTIAPLPATLFSSGQRAVAQLMPDNTLGSERSIVSPNRPVRGLPAALIEGGARRGVNLFQSFSDFNVGNGQRVYFANPAGIQNILSRVTGSNPSQILGTLGVDGAANLFLLNPHGILFGPNARLDIAGSFVASTASKLVFEDGLAFSATDPQAPPLLALNLRPGLQYGTDYRGDITNNGTLAVGAGQTLTLAGSAVTSSGSLTAPGGTIQVLGDRVSLLDNARVDVSSAGGGGTVLIGGDFQGKGQVPNASQTWVGNNVLINADAVSNGNGGNVIVWANNHTRFDGTISARGGANSGNGGAVEVSGKQTLNFNGHVDTSATRGSVGSLLLDPFDLDINQPFTSAADTTFQADNNITFNAPVTITTVGAGVIALAGNNIFVNSDISTIGGSVTLKAQQGNVSINGATIATGLNRNNDNGFTGVAGNIELTAGKQVVIQDGALLGRSNSASNQGANYTTIKLSGDSVNLDNTTISTTNLDAGVAGDIAITAYNEVNITNSKGPTIVQNGVLLPQPPGIFSQGDQGRILIGESLYFTFSPAVVNLDNSQLVTNNLSINQTTPLNAGNISIHALNSISLANGSSLSSSTIRLGDAGNITLTTDNGSIAIDGGSIIFDNVEHGGRGNAGNIRIETGALTISNDSQLQTLVRGPDSSQGLDRGQGDPGNVIILASDSTSLLNNSSIFSTIELDAIGGSGSNRFAGGLFDALLGQGQQPLTGSILIGTSSLSLSNNSTLTASTLGQGNAGGVFVLASGDVSFTNSSGILSAVYSQANGDAGGIAVGARNLLADNGSRLTTETAGQGNAGGIVVVVNKLISLNNDSAILSQVDPGLSQDAGAISLTSNSIHIRNNSAVSVDNNGSGLAGDIEITTRGIWLDNQGFISAQSNSGQGGNIFLQVPGAIILGRSSAIQANAGNPGAQNVLGGNIAIGTGDRQANNGAPSFSGRIFLVAGQTPRNNNILAEASGINTAQGGNIRVNAFRLQDIQQRPDFVTRNDISAAGKGAGGVDGSVVVNTLDVFPSVRTNPLPDRYDIPTVSEGCDPRVRQETTRFTATGRGGIAANPNDVLNQETLVDSGDAPGTSLSAMPSDRLASTAIVPAQGWVREADGSIRFTAYPTDPTVPAIPYPLRTPTTCHAR